MSNYNLELLGSFAASQEQSSTPSSTSSRDPPTTDAVCSTNALAEHFPVRTEKV
jgi:hypothetical protein